MAFFEWQDDYSVGIPSIDAEHKQLVELLNEIYTAMKERRANAIAMGVLDELIDYTRRHFSHEERLMKLHRYPDYETHKGRHDAIAARVVSFRNKVASKEMSLIEVGNYLKDWLVKHIAGTDQRYSAYLIDKGVR